MKIINEASRILLGVLFIFSGFVKGVDPVGVSYKFMEYLQAWHFEVFTPLALFFSCLLCLIEFGLGVALLTNVWRKAVAWKVLVLMSFFTVTTFISVLTNPISDCGCFGDAMKLTNWETFYKNVLFIILAGINLFASYHPKEISHMCKKQIATTALIAAFAFLMWYCYAYLPILDFRPYHMGANIVKSMNIPEDAPVDEYENTFVYRNLNTGEEKEFNESNYPWQDTTNWEYVDMQSKLIKKGYEAPIRDFYMMTEDAEDVKDFFLSDSYPTFFFVSTHTENAEWKNTNKLQDIIDYCNEERMSFVGLTASSIEDANKLAFMNGLKMEFFNCDEVALKTMIRSNPGLILTQQGTILKKWSINEIPSRKEVKNILSNFEKQKQRNNSKATLRNI
ncbi:MAG: BT_3928 family protein [Mangrovibacterium sp.]